MSKDPLKPGYLEAYIELENKLHSMSWDIGNRVGEVVNIICDEFGVEHPDTIYFEDAEEGDIGRPDLESSNSIAYEWYSYAKPCPSLKAGEWYFHCEVPKEYMYWTSENIRMDVRKHIKKDEAKKKAAKAKREATKKKKKDLAAAAKKKLTKAELKALGVK